MEASGLHLDLSKHELLNEKKSINELNLNYDFTKLLLNKMNSLGRSRPTTPKQSRSSSVNEIPFSPTKCFNELNFYKTEFDLDGDNEDEADEEEANELEKCNEQSNEKCFQKNENEIGKLLQLKQIKQLNELIFLNPPNKMSINLQDQFELDSLSSSEHFGSKWKMDSSAFVLQCLNRHNYLRKKHNVLNLNLSKNVCAFS